VNVKGIGHAKIYIQVILNDLLSSVEKNIQKKRHDSDTILIYSDHDFSNTPHNKHL